MKLTTQRCSLSSEEIAARSPSDSFSRLASTVGEMRVECVNHLSLTEIAHAEQFPGPLAEDER